MKEFPRRNQIELMCPAELAIRNAVMEVEKLPAADTRLTSAVVLLGQAQEQVADYIDKVPRKEEPPKEEPPKKVGDRWISSDAHWAVGLNIRELNIRSTRLLCLAVEFAVRGKDAKANDITSKVDEALELLQKGDVASARTILCVVEGEYSE